MAMIAEKLGFVDDERALYDSVCSARTIRCKRLPQRVNEAARGRLFTEIVLEADTEVA